jgi:sugar phosphate isomerase/epimerase
MGFDGLEILQRQLEDTDRASLQKIKRHAFTLGLDLMGFSTHQGFLSPDKAERQKNIDHTTDCLEQAYQLGIPTIRVNSAPPPTRDDARCPDVGVEKAIS